MAITRKPAPGRPPVSTVDVDDLINRGGSSPAAAAAVSGSKPAEETDDRVVPVILRLPPSMLRGIDTAVRNRPVRIPRHTWLLEAIHEKLSREAGSSEATPETE